MPQSRDVHETVLWSWECDCGETNYLDDQPESDDTLDCAHCGELYVIDRIYPLPTS